MNNIFLSLCSVLALEFFIRLNITSKLKYFNNLLKKIQKKLLSKKNTDYTKEKALKKYSIKLLKQTLIIFLVAIVKGLLANFIRRQVTVGVQHI